MYRIEDNICVGESGKYGKSLFSNKDFKKDDLVFIAYGPLTKKVSRYTIPISKDLKIDPTQPENNLSQYICHSCDPNLGIKGRTCFVAFRDIKKGDEITIDYAMIGYEYGDEVDKDGRNCKCGSGKCRGRWGSYKELPESIRQEYKGYISDYLLEM
jgi:hypothetical protein